MTRILPQRRTAEPGTNDGGESVSPSSLQRGQQSEVRTMQAGRVHMGSHCPQARKNRGAFLFATPP
jgi:hypothetical protein